MSFPTIALRIVVLALSSSLLAGVAGCAADAEADAQSADLQEEVVPTVADGIATRPVDPQLEMQQVLRRFDVGDRIDHLGDVVEENDTLAPR